MASSCNTIIQSLAKGVFDESLKAAATLYPGHVVEVASSTTCQKNGTAASNAIPCVAVEMRELNKGTTDAYAQNDRVRRYFPRRGEQVFLRVAAAATAITFGAFLETSNDGTVMILGSDAATDQTQRISVIAQALEAVDNSGGGTEVFVLAQIV